MTVSATSKLRPEDVKRGVVQYKSQHPFTPGGEVEDWVGIQVPGMEFIQNFSLKYWILEAAGAGAGAAAGGGGATSGGARRRRGASASQRKQSKRRQRYTKKK